jgi:hypothetical protein
LQDPPKFTPIGIFGLKIYHLATLVKSGPLKPKRLCACLLISFLLITFFPLSGVDEMALRQKVDFRNVDFQNVDFQNVEFKL